MEMYGYTFVRESDLMHHGIKGQRWGQRRFQNEDGTWTLAGKQRYGAGSDYGMRGSASGAGHRALAKVYDVNQRYYSKRDGARAKMMANANAQARAQQLKKAELADQRKRENGPSFADKAANVVVTKANKAVAKKGGRRINADYDTRLKRGEQLKYQKRTSAGAVGRTIGRQIIINGSDIVAHLALNGVSMAVAMKSPAAAKGIQSVGNVMLSHGTKIATAANVVRGYQDIADIRTYNKSKH